MSISSRYGRAIGADHWRRWVWLGVTLVTLVTLAVGMVRLVPARPQTHREAIATLLAHYAQPAHEIIIGELQRPPSGNCFLHDCRDLTASVIVVQEQRLYGRFVCHDGTAACVFTLPARHIYNQPLTDVAGTSRFPRTNAEWMLVAQAWVRSQITVFLGYRRPSCVVGYPWPGEV